MRPALMGILVYEIEGMPYAEVARTRGRGVLWTPKGGLMSANWLIPSREAVTRPLFDRLRIDGAVVYLRWTLRNHDVAVARLWTPVALLRRTAGHCGYDRIHAGLGDRGQADSRRDAFRAVDRVIKEYERGSDECRDVVMRHTDADVSRCLDFDWPPWIVYDGGEWRLDEGGLPAEAKGDRE